MCVRVSERERERIREEKERERKIKGKEEKCDINKRNVEKIGHSEVADERMWNEKRKRNMK